MTSNMKSGSRATRVYLTDRTVLIRKVNANHVVPPEEDPDTVKGMLNQSFVKLLQERHEKNVEVKSRRNKKNKKPPGTDLAKLTSDSDLSDIDEPQSPSSPGLNGQRSPSSPGLNGQMSPSSFSVNVSNIQDPSDDTRMQRAAPAQIVEEGDFVIAFIIFDLAHERKAKNIMLVGS